MIWEEFLRIKENDFILYRESGGSLRRGWVRIVRDIPERVIGVQDIDRNSSRDEITYEVFLSGDRIIREERLLNVELLTCAHEGVRLLGKEMVKVDS